MGAKSREKREKAEMFSRLEAVYARIPKMVECKGKCEDSCTVVAATRPEKARIEKRLGKKMEAVEVEPGKWRCSALTPEGRCSVYSIRPTICRMFGTTRGLGTCEYGCLPERYLMPNEWMDILQEVEAITSSTHVAETVPGIALKNLAEYKELRDQLT